MPIRPVLFDQYCLDENFDQYCLDENFDQYWLDENFDQYCLDENFDQYCSACPVSFDPYAHAARPPGPAPRQEGDPLRTISLTSTV